MRDGWLPLGLGLVGGVALLACGQPFELSGSTATSTGAGGATSTAAVGGASGSVAASSGGGTGTPTSSTTTTATTGGGQCMKAGDCPGPTTLCGDAACQAGMCGIHQLQPDGASFSQLYGDCQVAMCNKATLSYKVKKEDIYDDGNPCTLDACDNGVPSNTVTLGAPCGNNNGVCSATGTCVECVTNGTCPGEKPTCINNYCSASTCQNGGQVPIPDGNETDVDCGGDACGPCDPGKTCKTDSDCKSKVCKEPFMNAPVKQCQIASCKDSVQNGSETDVDCGGVLCSVSNKCDDQKHCATPDDCKSGVCQAGICLKAACNDGVKNGTETGIDCGGGAPGCASKCPGG